MKENKNNRNYGRQSLGDHNMFGRLFRKWGKGTLGHLVVVYNVWKDFGHVHHSQRERFITFFFH